MQFYRIDNRGPWGDYGDILASGMPFDPKVVAGRLAIQRTGPFVPPLTFPGRNVVVTEEFRDRMRGRFGNFRVSSVVKGRITNVPWHEWDLTADQPRDFPPGGEPENYILELPHCEATSEQLGDLWEVRLQEGAKGRFWGRPSRLTINLRSWNGDELFWVSPNGLRIAVVSDAAKEWLSKEAGEWLAFTEVVME